MKQIEATPQRPFYSVGYVYERCTGTCHSYNFWGMKIPLEKKMRGKTMSGTDDEELAFEAANQLLACAGVSETFVHVTTDCYNHKEALHLTR